MSLLIERNINPKAYEAAESIIDTINEVGKLLVANHKLGFDRLWNNPDATPEEIVDAMGVDATYVFQCALANLSVLSTCASYSGKTLNDFMQPIEYMPHKTVNFNQDGAAILTPLV